MYSAPTIYDNSDFEFFSKIGADESMIDYAKMTILFSFQREFDTVFKKCEIIRKKFEEKYGGSWIVGIFQNNLSDISACYDKYCLCVFIKILHSKYSNYFEYLNYYLCSILIIIFVYFKFFTFLIY